MIFSFFDNPILLLFMIPTVLIALSAHEAAHGYAAYKLGDPTAKALGRLTMNPLKHINPLGALCMLLVGFGWANPVPVNPRYFKNPRKGMAIVAAAGPLMSFCLSVIGAILYSVLLALIPLVYEVAFLVKFLYYAALFFYVFHIMNLTFCVFNLLPFPPLDGYRILSIVLPAKAAYWIHRHEKQLYYGFLAWMLVGSNLCSFLLDLGPIAASPLLSFFVRLLSVSEWVDILVTFLSSLLLKLFSFFSLL